MYIRWQQMRIPETWGWISACSAQLHLLLTSRQVLINKGFSTWLFIWSSKIYSYFSKGASPDLTVKLFQAESLDFWGVKPKREFKGTSRHGWVQSTALLAAAGSPRADCKHHSHFILLFCPKRWSLGSSQPEQSTALNSDVCLEWESLERKKQTPMAGNCCWPRSSAGSEPKPSQKVSTVLGALFKERYPG